MSQHWIYVLSPRTGAFNLVTTRKVGHLSPRLPKKWAAVTNGKFKMARKKRAAAIDYAQLNSFSSVVLFDTSKRKRKRRWFSYQILYIFHWKMDACFQHLCLFVMDTCSNFSLQRPCKLLVLKWILEQLYFINRVEVLGYLVEVRLNFKALPLQY